MTGWLFRAVYTGTRPGVSPAIRAGKGWRGRRELAPRCSATQFGACSCVHIDRDMIVIPSSEPPPPPPPPPPHTLAGDLRTAVRRRARLGAAGPAACRVRTARAGTAAHRAADRRSCPFVADSRRSCTADGGTDAGYPAFLRRSHLILNKSSKDVHVDNTGALIVHSCAEPPGNKTPGDSGGVSAQGLKNGHLPVTHMRHFCQKTRLTSCSRSIVQIPSANCAEHPENSPRDSSPSSRRIQQEILPKASVFWSMNTARSDCQILLVEIMSRISM